MVSNVINGLLVQYTDDNGKEMSAIVQDGKIKGYSDRENESVLVKEWNSSQRSITNRKRAKAFNEKNTIYIRTNLNRTNDADILEHLNNLSIPKAQYIKELIREDMKKYNK